MIELAAIVTLAVLFVTFGVFVRARPACGDSCGAGPASCGACPADGHDRPSSSA